MHTRAGDQGSGAAGGWGKGTSSERPHKQILKNARSKAMAGDANSPDVCMPLIASYACDIVTPSQESGGVA